MTESMLCEWCDHLWPRDPMKPIPTQCPQCKWTELLVVGFDSAGSILWSVHAPAAVEATSGA